MEALISAVEEGASIRSSWIFGLTHFFGQKSSSFSVLF
jgi:hypothetical protein